MKMSVYRQQAEMITSDHTVCSRAATTEADIDLLDLAVRLSKPVLVGLEGQLAIVKPNEPNDEAMSFEALFDTCITSADLALMREHEVENPENIPERQFRAELQVAIEGILRIPINLKAAKHGDIKARLQDAVKDKRFYFELSKQICQAIFNENRESHSVVYSIGDATDAIGKADQNTPLWEFPE